MESNKYSYSKEKKTILVVEPNADLLDMLSSFLEPKFNVIKAQSGSDVLNILLKIDVSTIHLMITSGLDNKVSGIDLVKEAKKVNIKTIIATGDMDLEKFFDAGAVDVLQKPFTVEELYSSIEQVVQSA